MAQVGVLLVDPDQSLVGPIRQSLEGHPYEVRLAGSAAHARDTCGGGGGEGGRVSVGGGGAGPLIADIPGGWPALPVVAVTEPGGRTQGFQARAAGAWDYLETPGDLTPERLVTAVANAL